MDQPARRVTIECQRCHREYDDWYRPPVNVALDPSDETSPERSRTTTCPSCGFILCHGVMRVREEAGVWIVEAMSQDQVGSQKSDAGREE